MANENMACRIFKEQIELIQQLPENERAEVLYKAILCSLNQIENQNEKQNESAYVSVSVSVSVLSNIVYELLRKNIQWKEFSNNYGGKRIGAGKKKTPISVSDVNPAVDNKAGAVENFDFNNRDIFTQMLPNDLLHAIKTHVVSVLQCYLYFGEPPTDEQLVTYIQHRVGNGWKKENGKPINNIALDLAEWLKNEKRRPLASNDKEIEVFVAAWNERVYKSLKSVSIWTDVIEATMDNSKDRFATAKAELTKLIAEVKKKQAEGKKPFLGISVPFDNIWVFAAEMFCKRRFYSTFLSSECKTTPAFFLKNIKTLADPYSDEYLDDSQKWYHD